VEGELDRRDADQAGEVEREAAQAERAGALALPR